MATYSSQSTRSEPASLSDAGGGNQMSAWWWTEDRLQSVWSLFSKSQGDAVKDSAGVRASCMWMKCSLEDGLNSCVLLQLRATEHSRERGWRNETHVVPWAIAPSPGYASSSKNGWEVQCSHNSDVMSHNPYDMTNYQKNLVFTIRLRSLGPAEQRPVKTNEGQDFGTVTDPDIKEAAKVA